MCSLLVIFASCSKKGAGVSETQPVVVQAFTPPADSIITPGQFSKWLACSKPLDSLSRKFAESKTLNSGDSIHYLFSRSQDTVCARCGLEGGYRQYVWIRDNAGTIKNRHLVDSAGTLK
jgi:hypothetical protein